MKIPRINTYVLLGLLLGSGGLLGTMVASQGKAPLIFSSNPSTSQLCSKETKQTRTSKQTGISICDAMKQKPGTPVEVKAAPSIGKTVISWQANCGDIIRYTVYRRLATNEYTKI